MLDKVVDDNTKVVFRNGTGLAVIVFAMAVVEGDAAIVAVSGWMISDPAVVVDDNKRDTQTPQVRGHDVATCVMVLQKETSLSQSSIASWHSEIYFDLKYLSNVCIVLYSQYLHVSSRLQSWYLLLRWNNQEWLLPHKIRKF